LTEKGPFFAQSRRGVTVDLITVLCATKVSPTPAELPRTKQVVDVLTLRRRERPWAGSVPASFSAEQARARS
jgi:hypothetical protein